MLWFIIKKIVSIIYKYLEVIQQTIINVLDYIKLLAIGSNQRLKIKIYLYFLFIFIFLIVIIYVINFDGQSVNVWSFKPQLTEFNSLNLPIKVINNSLIKKGDQAFQIDIFFTQNWHIEFNIANQNNLEHSSSLIVEQELQTLQNQQQPLI